MSRIDVIIWSPKFGPSNTISPMGLSKMMSFKSTKGPREIYYDILYIIYMTGDLSKAGTELYGLDNISPFSKFRTVGRHAGDHHGRRFRHRV